MNEESNGKRPPVSIVCVSYNRRELLLKCLRSCVKQDYPSLEIVLILNPSSDGSEEAVMNEFPQVRVTRTHRNIGFFPALNLAIANAHGDYVMTVDDDAYFLRNDAISCLVNAFEGEPGLGAVTCNLEGPTERPEANDRYVHLFTTGFTMLPRQAFTEWVGYYPDLFFRSGGETYMCAMLWQQRRPVKRLSTVRMYHARAMQGRADWDWKFHALRSQILVTLMREPWFLILPSLLSKVVKSFFQYLRNGQLRVWIWAWLSALVHLPDSLKLRKPISWRTQKLMWRLRDETVHDVTSLA